MSLPGIHNVGATDHAKQRSIERAVPLDDATTTDILTRIAAARLMVGNGSIYLKACIDIGAVRISALPQGRERWAVRHAETWVYLVMSNLLIVTVLTRDRMRSLKSAGTIRARKSARRSSKPTARAIMDNDARA